MKMTIIKNTFVKGEFMEWAKRDKDGKVTGPNVVDVSLEDAKELFSAGKAKPVNEESFLKAVRSGKEGK